MANTPISGPGTTPNTAVVDDTIFPIGGSGKPTTTASLIKTYISSFPSLGVSPVDGSGLFFRNNTLAAPGAQQISPVLTFRGSGWKTNAIAGSQFTDFRQYVLPVQGAANPTSLFKTESQINGGGYNLVHSIDNFGTVDTYVNLNSANIFHQRWNDASGTIKMSFGAINTGTDGPALKIIGDITESVELALVQSNASPRNYGWYWLVDSTTSTLKLVRRVNNVDTNVQTFGNTTGNYNQVGNVDITGTLAVSDATTITKNFAGTLLFKIVNTTATGTPQLSFQNNQKIVSIGAYGSSAGGAYKILQDGDFHIFNPTAGNINILNDFATGDIRFAGRGASSPSLTINGNGIVLGAGAASAGSSPFKMTSGTNLTTAEAGAMEYNGTNLFFTRAGTTRENILVAVDNASAPSTTVTPTFTSYYGGNTNTLGDPNRWVSVNILGSVYKIPLYT